MRPNLVFRAGRELPSKIRSNDDIATAVGRSIIQFFWNFTMFPNTYMFNASQCCYNRVYVMLFSDKDVGGIGSDDSFAPLGFEIIVPVDETLRTDFHHAMVCGNNDIYLIPMRQCSQLPIHIADY